MFNEEESEKGVIIVKNGSNLFLYFIVVIVNLGSFTAGIGFTWSSPVLTKLTNTTENPLGHPLSEDELSWLASIIALGAVVGPFAGGYLADKIGRKRTFIITAVPTILSYIFLGFVSNLHLYYIARFIIGSCAGIFMTLVPMYIGEVAEVNNRGSLGCSLMFFYTIGLLYSLVVGPYISIQWFNLSIVIAPTIFLIIVALLVPESPCYLLLNKRYAEAKEILEKLRYGDVDDEFSEMIAFIKESAESKGKLSDIWKSRTLSKALRVSIGLMIVLQLTALSVITFYLQLIFESAGSGFSSDIAAIIVGTVQIFGTCASTLTVEKLGRRPILLASSITTSISLFVFTIYLYLMDRSDVSAISWLPLVTLIVYIFFCNIGIGPLPFAMMGEIFPPHVRSIGSSVTICCCYILSFITTKIFPLLVTAMGNWFAFLVFAIGNSLGVIFIWYYVPETKGKTVAEILNDLK